MSDPPPATVIVLLLFVLPTMSPLIVAALVSTGEDPFVPLSTMTGFLEVGGVLLLQLDGVFQLVPVVPVQ